jgi:hypothetical protein
MNRVGVPSTWPEARPLSTSRVGGLDPGLYDFRLLQQSDDRGCENVLVGRWQDLAVNEADYWFAKVNDTRRSGGGQFSFSISGKDRSFFSIVIADLAATVPRVAVRKRAWSPRLRSTWDCTTLTSNPRTSTAASGCRPRIRSSPSN